MHTVDDEMEFVQMISERLQMRHFSVSVAYNGEEALSSYVFPSALLEALFFI